MTEVIWCILISHIGYDSLWDSQSVSAGRFKILSILAIMLQTSSNKFRAGIGQLRSVFLPRSSPALFGSE